MVYSGKVQRMVLVSMLAVLYLPGVFTSHQSSAFELYFQLVISFFIISALFIKYRLMVREEDIIYQISVWNISIYSIVVHAEKIRELRFKRTGWNVKEAIIHVEKGFDIKVLFSPMSIFSELMIFAAKNNISVKISKDYEALERVGS